MLRRLEVRRLAVIEDLAVDFAPRFNVLSGETGAGKSILVTAIGLALGWRATADLIRTGCDDAEVVATFDAVPPAAADLLAEFDVPPADALAVRRVIQLAGRNKVEINDRPVPLQALRRLGETLLNLYGQHEAQGLMRPESHLLFLDAYAGRTADRAALGDLVRRVQSLDAAVVALEKRDADRDARAGYLRYALAEIDAAQLLDREDEDLAARVKVLANAEHLLRLAREAAEVLYDGEGAVAERVGALARAVADRADLDEHLRPLADGLQDLLADAEDLAGRARDYAESLEVDPAQLERLEQRRQLIYDLKKKYGGSLDAVRDTAARARDELASLDNLAGEIDKLSRQRRALAADLDAAAAALSAARRQAAAHMQKEIEAELADLDMPGTRFVVSLEPLAAGGLVIADRRVDETGADLIEFLISPNVGELPRPLARIASGGELSRVMLAIQRALTRHFPVPTLIFDEIDAGVGGAQAERLGRKLRQVAAEHQVLCITHLPQIAALAHHHFLVKKTVSRGRTRAEVQPLDEDARVAEIARMLGGEKITDAARHAARELRQTADRAPSRRQAAK